MAESLVTLDGAIKLLQFIIAVVVIPGTLKLITVMVAIREHLSKLNGRVTAVETWSRSHEKSNDERHHDNRQILRTLTDRLDQTCLYRIAPADEWDGRDRRKPDHRRD